MQAKEKEDKQGEMYIDSGMPDLENEANQIELIRSYIKGESRKETMLHTTLESMIETLKRNRNISKELMQ